jgi:hypothetical protein
VELPPRSANKIDENSRESEDSTLLLGRSSSEARFFDGIAN